MRYITSVPLAALAVPFIAVCLAVMFELSLQLTALLTLSLTLGISLVLPTIAIAIGILVVLTAQFTLALGLSLPSLTLNLAISLSIELAHVLSLLVQLELMLALKFDLVAYGWFGTGAEFGPAVSAQLAGGWPDGTPADQDITAFVFVATSPGPTPFDSVASLSLVAPPPTPPAPPPPAEPPPPGAYPPPQSYTAGLARVVITAPPPGGNTATGSVSVDSSVSTGIGAVTAVTLDAFGGGSGYTAPPGVVITDAAPIVSASVATPVVVTLPDPLVVPIASGFACTIAGVLPKEANINGPAFAKVLTPTTVELYSDAAFTVPIVGAGTYTGGTLAGSGTGSVAIATMGGGAQQTMRLFFSGMSWPTVSGTLAGGTIAFSDMLAGEFGLMTDLRTELKARASLLGGVTASVGVIPPSISASLEFLANLKANLEANLNVSLPDLSVSLGAQLSAQIGVIGSLVARIGLYLGLDGSLLVYKYTGPGRDLGSAIGTAGSSAWQDGTPGSTPVVAGVFGLTNPGAAAGFSVFFPVAA